MHLGRHPVKPLRNFVKPENKHMVSEEGIDLIEKMLVYDKNARIMPQEAMMHPYFTKLRDERENDL